MIVNCGRIGGDEDDHGHDHGHDDGHPDDDPGGPDDRHAQKMARQRAAKERMAAERSGDKGLIIVHTGAGKGKSTAAFGMILRALGHGFRVAMVQFSKGTRASGERAALFRFGDQITLATAGEGFSWETADRHRDAAAARAGWTRAEAFLADPSFRLVVLDEINVMLRHNHLPLSEVLAALAARPPGMHVVLTGRNAPPQLVARADLVTEMTLVKHPHRAGIQAQPGIEY
jgi:cob(I)alamin adenosyltransferase